jgi:cyanophycinase
LLTLRSALIAAAALALGSHCSVAHGQVVGPTKGSLVVVGGNMYDTAIVNRFIKLAGGPSAKIVVVPTADGGPTCAQDWSGAKMLRDAGATNIYVLHTIDPRVANTDEFVKPLLDANAVWFGGGRQWHIVDSYAGTKTEVEFRRVLERGGVIGGSSAGASIQGSYLARGDTKSNELMMGDHDVGFGYLKNTAVDQHVLVRNRQFDLIDLVEKKPELLGIGLDENTAIVVRGDTADVIGATYAIIYDAKRIATEHTKFIFAKSGQKIDLKNRTVIAGRGGGGGGGRDR